MTTTTHDDAVDDIINGLLAGAKYGRLDWSLSDCLDGDAVSAALVDLLLTRGGPDVQRKLDQLYVAVVNAAADLADTIIADEIQRRKEED